MIEEVVLRGTRALATSLVFLVISTMAQPNSPSARPLTDAQCEAFGHELEDHFASGDKDFYANSIDADAMLDRIIALHKEFAEEAEAHRADFRKGFNNSLKSRLSVDITSLKCLRVKRVNGEPRLLCRQIGRQGGLAYVEFILGRRARGQVRIVDVFVYTTSELFSQTLSRLYF